MKKMLPLMSGDIPNIHFMLDAQERKLRTFLFNHLITSSRPIFIRDIMNEKQISEIDVSTVVNSLIEKGLIAIRGDMSISGLYPISAEPTRHRVQLKDGRFLYAVCAIASLGVAFELEQDLVISSSCPQCKTEIYMDIVDGKISSLSPTTALAFSAPLGKSQKRTTPCGSNTDFYCTQKHLEEWLAANSSIRKRGGYCLNLHEAGLVAKAISGKANSLVDGGKIILTSVELFNLTGKL
jgi:hypothetical protein